jgi:hypothetical protein
VHDWTVDAILTAANLPTAVPADLERVAKARRTLRYVSGNVAIKLHSGEMSEEQAVEYIQTYALATEARARQTLSFIVNPLFRAYIFTYTAGYDLIAQAAHGADKTPLFKRLLQEQILPSHLVAM